MRSYQSKILPLEELKTRRACYREENIKVVFTNGTFDILHQGHVSYLQFARTQGDVLIVGVNADCSVRAYKGAHRPINPEQDRLSVVAGLESVDHAILFEEKEPLQLIQALLPNVLVKGEDWAHYICGREIVEEHGGRVVLAPLVDERSTTRTIERIKATQRNSQIKPPKSPHS